MGKPVWVLVSHAPDWRWLLNRDDSDWYPSARIFRQGAIDDWSQPLHEVHDALLQMGAKAGKQYSGMKP
jgi:hypothetical protein